MGYIKTSTANPLGWRALNAQLTQPVVRNHQFRVAGPSGTDADSSGTSGGAGLSGYYPANYYVPTPGNIHGCDVPNVLGDLGDFINNLPWLRPGQWRSRDNLYSPIPRIYVPPELANNGLGDADGFNAPSNAGRFSFWDILRRHPRFSGGVSRPDPANPTGRFFPRTPAAPAQFALGNRAGVGVPSPDPGDPRGHYFPKTPRVGYPAWLRVRQGNWTQANPNSLDGLGALGATISTISAPHSIVRPVAPIVVTGPVPVRAPVASPVRTPTPVRTPVPRPTPPVVVVGRRSPTGISPVGQPIVTGPAPLVPIVTPGTPPTYPAGVVPVGSGMCSVTSTPETGGVVSVVPCAGVPGYSAGTPASTTYAPGAGNSVPVLTHINRAVFSTQLNRSVNSSTLALAQASASAGTLTSSQLTGLTAAQQQALIAANQQALAAQAGGASPATDATTAAAAPDSSAADVLGWLSQSTLITGVPNWVIAGGGGLLVLWIMNRGKK